MNNTELYNAMRNIPRHGNTSIMIVFYLLDLLSSHLSMMKEHSSMPVIISEEVANYYKDGYYQNACRELMRTNYRARNEIRNLLSVVEEWKKVTKNNFSYFQGYNGFKSSVCRELSKHLNSFFEERDPVEKIKKWNDVSEVVDFCRSSWLNTDRRKHQWLKELNTKIPFCSEILLLLNGKLCFIPEWCFDNESYIMKIIEMELQNDPWAPVHYLDEARNRYVLITLTRLLLTATEIKEATKPAWVISDELEDKVSRLERRLAYERIYNRCRTDKERVAAVTTEVVIETADDVFGLIGIGVIIIVSCVVFALNFCLI
ncbi:hypothetical protein KMI_04g07100 [Encephalitozoon hellem]|nr:hypothetical protein KMI_04g07100 [Encephalitozoon hellem]